MHSNRLAAGLLAVAAAALAPSASAQGLDLVRVASGFSGAIYMTQPRGDFERHFVVEQSGRIRVVRDGAILPTPFLNLGTTGLNKITAGGERGLLGLAFHPDYADNGHFYVDYTNLQGNTVVERYTVSANPDVADPGSGAIVIGPISQPQANHNGGCLQFGPDGMLYIAMGDGGGANDSGTGHVAGGNAQSGANLLGKILRLDVDLPFPHIPPDNPFVGTPSFQDEIWHYGVRNPWRFSFDSATGDMYIGDVGQDSREEISFAPAGASALNFGWRCMEGFNCTGLSGCTCNGPTLTLPIHDYPHSPGCVSVTGGYMYRGCAIPGLTNTYYFADYCKRNIWSFEFDGTTKTNFVDRTAELTPNVGTIGAIPSFGLDQLGEIYVVDSDELFKIVPDGLVDCNGNFTADGCEIALGLSPDINGNGVPDECECLAAQTYCTAKTTSGGCVPAISALGLPKSNGGFVIQASQIEPNQLGVLFYSTVASNNQPFQGGFLCVQPPVRRLPVQDSGGAGPCSGTFSDDFSAWIVIGGDPSLVPGQQLWAQYWFRDPGVPSGTGLSNALTTVICQ